MMHLIGWNGLGECIPGRAGHVLKSLYLGYVAFSSRAFSIGKLSAFLLFNAQNCRVVVAA